MNTSPLFKKIALIGFGLIGGSIARAARKQGLAGEIVATARSAKTRARVKELGIVDRVVDTNTEAVTDADLVILCIPVGACGEGHVDSFTVSKADHRKIMLTLNGYVTSQFDQASFPVTFNFLNRVFCIKNIRVGKPKGQYHEATVEAEGFAGVTS